MTITKQTVYIPTNGEQQYMVCYTSDSGDDYLPEEPVTQVEAYVFTKEQLEKLLETYTEKIIEDVDLVGEDAHRKNQPLIYSDSVYVTDSNGPDYVFTVDKESIRKQLPEFLKEIKL